MVKLLGGVIVDRYDRLRLLTGIQLLRCVPMLGLAILYFMDILALRHMAVLATLWATIRSMNPTAGQSMLGDLVPESELMSPSKGRKRETNGRESDGT